MTADLHPTLREYYTEMDPTLRQKHLRAYIASRDSEAGKPAGAGADSAADYRNDLFEARHIGRKKHSPFVDRFLMNLMTLISIYNNPGLFPKRHKKEVLSILHKMELDERPSQDKNCENALYLEYRHAIRRYYSTCEEGPYASKLLGLAPGNKEDRERRRCYDTWAFSYGIASLVGLEKELELLCRAASDEYFDSVQGTASLQEAFTSYKENG